MRDRETDTIWNHLDGKATLGALAGERLRMIPLPLMTWSAWLDEHPESTVPAFDTPYEQYYRSVPLGGFDQDEALYGDDRLPSNALVLGVEVDESYRAYPLPTLEGVGGVVNDELGGQAVAAIYDPKSGTAIAYSRVVQGLAITLRLVDHQGASALEDIGTGSLWNIEGVGISGSLAAERLDFVPSIISEWYGWSAYHPDTDLFDAEGQQV